MSELLDKVVAARQAGVPILGVTTADPAGAMAQIAEAIQDFHKAKKLPAPALLRWDCVMGLTPLPQIVNDKMINNPEGIEAIKRLFEKGGPLDGAEESSFIFADEEKFLAAAYFLAPYTIVFCQNAHRILVDPTTGIGVNRKATQGIWNLRDPYKSTDRMLILFGPELSLPPELAHDVVVIDHPLPGDPELGVILDEIHEAAELDRPAGEARDKALTAVRGLASFAAEQSIAMSIDYKLPAKERRLDLGKLWDRKRTFIEGVRGLSIVRNALPFDQIGGDEVLKEYQRGLIEGGEPPALIAWIDEMDKAAVGNKYDQTTADAIGVFLTEMQEQDWYGSLYNGVTGSGKSLAAKALGATYGIETLRFDFGDLKDKWVGSSEENIRNAVRTIKAIGGRRVYWIATCNSVDVFSPELLGRFAYGQWFFDVPTREEKKFIWPLILKQHGLDPKSKLPDDTGWVGRDIYSCVAQAKKLRCSPAQAARYVVPVVVSDPRKTEQLRSIADGRFLSVSYPGAYQKAKAEKIEIEIALPAANGGAGRRLVH